MITVGFVTVESTPYLQCASVHLTAFLGSFSTSGLDFSVNEVDPIGDAGNILVGISAAFHRVLLRATPTHWQT